MIPKIEFVYSRVYDDMQRNSAILQRKLKLEKEKYPTRKEIINYMKKINKLWKKYEDKILKKISKITGLKWKENKIKCYIVGIIRPFSDPLTIRLYKDKNDFIDTLVHELIHQIQIQNVKKMKKWLIYIDKNYKNESILTKNHILLHAVHTKIYETIFSKKRLLRDINKSKIQDYKRAWDIVIKEGADNIIKCFKQITK